MILGYLLKNKSVKQVVSKIDIFSSPPTKVITAQNKYKIRFLDKFLLEKNVDKLMITAINCSMLESPSTSDDEELSTGYYKSTHLEDTMKHLAKKTRL